MHPVTMCQLQCDCCGTILDDYGDYTAMSDLDACRECAGDDGWLVIDGHDYCPICWTWPSDDASSDDPAPHPQCKPGEAGQ